MAVSYDFAPTTTAVGIPLTTSSAWLGPERIAISQSGRTSFNTCDKVNNVDSSIPFATLTIFCPAFIKGAAWFATLLTYGEATENTISWKKPEEKHLTYRGTKDELSIYSSFPQTTCKQEWSEIF